MSYGHAFFTVVISLTARLTRPRLGVDWGHHSEDAQGHDPHLLAVRIPRVGAGCIGRHFRRALVLKAQA